MQIFRIWEMIPGSTGKEGGDEAEKAGKSAQGVLVSRLLLWAAGAQLCWGPLGASESCWGPLGATSHSYST